jgi:hypothetical protein
MFGGSEPAQPPRPTEPPPWALIRSQPGFVSAVDRGYAVDGLADPQSYPRAVVRKDLPSGDEWQLGNIRGA